VISSLLMVMTQGQVAHTSSFPTERGGRGTQSRSLRRKLLPIDLTIWAQSWETTTPSSCFHSIHANRNVKRQGSHPIPSTSNSIIEMTYTTQDGTSATRSALSQTMETETGSKNERSPSALVTQTQNSYVLSTSYSTVTGAIYDINTLSACTAPQSDSTSFQSLDSETVQYFSDKALKINTLEVAISIVQYYLPFNILLQKDTCGNVLSVTITNKLGQPLAELSLGPFQISRGSRYDAFVLAQLTCRTSADKANVFVVTLFVVFIGLW